MKDKKAIEQMIEQLKTLDTKGMYLNDFFHTWKESDDEIHAIFTVAEVLRAMREQNISPKVFDSGLGISLFGTIPPGRGSVSPAPATCWGLRCRIWMRRRARSPMARRSVRRPT
jgi:hypothetical protein